VRVSFPEGRSIWPEKDLTIKIDLGPRRTSPVKVCFRSRKGEAWCAKFMAEAKKKKEISLKKEILE